MTLAQNVSPSVDSVEYRVIRSIGHIKGIGVLRRRRGQVFGIITIAVATDAVTRSAVLHIRALVSLHLLMKMWWVVYKRKIR